MNLGIIVMAAGLALAASQPVDSQNLPAANRFTYADLADLALAAPVAAHVRVERAQALRPDEAGTVPPGYRRFLIDASVVALIRGDAPLPARISYLVDLPNDARGRAARPRKRTEFLILATTVPGRPNDLRLAAPDAQIPFSPQAAETLRGIVREASVADAPPRVVGIGRAFHVPGSLPGESESQIFLQTADDRPISLNILRRPGERPRWTVALSEIVDAAAAPPQPESLLWYRLACTLPPTLPAQALREADRQEAQALQADYRLVIQNLGPCARTRRQR